MAFNPIRYVIRGVLRAIAGERGVKWFDKLVEFETGVPVNDNSDEMDDLADNKSAEDQT